MTEQNEQLDGDEQETITVEAVFRDSDNGEITIRTLLLGDQPVVLIEPKFGEDDEDKSVTFLVDVTDLDPDEAADLLELCAGAIRTANEKRLAELADVAKTDAGEDTEEEDQPE